MAASLQNATLTLCFTRGISLETWRSVGLLDREVALYRRLMPLLREVRFVTYGDRRDLRLAAALSGIRVTCNRWGLPSRWYARCLPWLAAAVWRRSTVIRSHQVPGAEIALAAARRFGKLFVARCGYLHSDFAAQRHGPDSPAASRARDLERRVFRGADRVVVTTDAMRETVCGRYGLPVERVRVIPNYVETDRFHPAPALPREPFRLCFVGRLEDQKNPLTLIEAVAGLDLELAIVGSGGLEAAVRELASARGVRAHFLGNVPNGRLPEVLRSASAFILPSRYEGHPKALLEAMACGLPVIGTRVPGIRELLHDGETGFLADPEPESLREAVRRVAADPERAAQIGRRARDYVVERFSLDRAARLEEALLAELLAERSAA